MTAELGSISDREPINPQWSIHPQEHEHAPMGRPPFDILYIPETPRLIRPSDIFVNTEGQSRRTDNSELEDSINSAIETRRISVEAFNEELEAQLVSEGKTLEEIEARKKKFFDGHLVRLHPYDIGVSGGGSLFLRLGETTYFTYAGTRRKEALQKYGYNRLGLPLAVCSVVTAPSEDGTEKVLYTVRGTANEAYPGWYHGIGGTIQTIQNGIPNPSVALRREVQEELGLKPDEFQVEGVSGLVMNNFDLHPELVYTTKVKTPIDRWYNLRETDKEVDAEFFTDTPENIANFILGQSFDEVPDARPIVPSGLAGYLLHGRIKYGQNWYNEVFKKIPQY